MQPGCGWDGPKLFKYLYCPPASPLSYQVSFFPNTPRRKKRNQGLTCFSLILVSVIFCIQWKIISWEIILCKSIQCKIILWKRIVFKSRRITLLQNSFWQRTANYPTTSLTGRVSFIRPRSPKTINLKEMMENIFKKNSFENRQGWIF